MSLRRLVYVRWRRRRRFGHLLFDVTLMEMELRCNLCITQHCYNTTFSKPCLTTGMIWFCMASLFLKFLGRFEHDCFILRFFGILKMWHQCILRKVMTTCLTSQYSANNQNLVKTLPQSLKIKCPQHNKNAFIEEPVYIYTSLLSFFSLFIIRLRKQSLILTSFVIFWHISLDLKK